MKKSKKLSLTEAAAQPATALTMKRLMNLKDIVMTEPAQLVNDPKAREIAIRVLEAAIAEMQQAGQPQQQTGVQSAADAIRDFEAKQRR